MRGVGERCEGVMVEDVDVREYWWKVITFDMTVPFMYREYHTVFIAI